MADELERALLLRDLELMAQPRNPNAVQPGRAGLLDLGVGLPERLSLLNQIFNPVEAIGQSMNAGERMMSPNMGVMDRLAALGDMASGIAGVVAPVAAASRAGAPAATALMEGLLGGSPTQQAAADMARGFVADESGALRLYHGSPHDFDRFSMSKIGTGEGAQAYGHGLYFAENEGVARGYQRALAGKAIPSGDPVSNAWDMIYRVGGNDPQMRDAVRQAFIDMMEDADPRTAEFARRSVEAIDSGAIDAFKAPGRMYEVEVNANPEDFIDFDAPWESQPEAVKRHFAYLAKGERKPTGEDLARRMESNIYIREAAEAGIPGIRYLDAGSRGAGDGSRNYVVFDENLINIVRKYGIAGAAAMLGVSAFDVEQAMAQGQQQPQGFLSTGVQ